MTKFKSEAANNGLDYDDCLHQFTPLRRNELTIVGPAGQSRIGEEVFFYCIYCLDVVRVVLDYDRPDAAEHHYRLVTEEPHASHQ